MTPNPAMRRIAISRPAPWLFAATYALHLVDEGAFFGGLAHWSTERGFDFTIENWVFANAISILVVLAGVHLVARGAWPSWVLVSISVHLALHAAIHTGASLLWSSISPGAITGLLLALPLATWGLLWGWRALDTRSLVYGVLVGAVTLQAPWDLLVRFLFGLPVWTA